MAFRTGLVKLWAMPAGQRRLLAEAALALAAAQMAILLVPFRLTARWLGRSSNDRLPPSAELAAQVRGAVLGAARHVPWKAACLAQAMAAKAMLARRGHSSILHLGLARDASGALIAHAWLEVDGGVVVGDRTQEVFTPIARFG